MESAHAAGQQEHSAPPATFELETGAAEIELLCCIVNRSVRRRNRHLTCGDKRAR